LDNHSADLTAHLQEGYVRGDTLSLTFTPQSLVVDVQPPAPSAHAHLALQRLLDETRALHQTWQHLIAFLPFLQHPAYSLTLRLTSDIATVALFHQDKSLHYFTPGQPPLAWVLAALRALHYPTHALRVSNTPLHAAGPEEGLAAYLLLKKPDTLLNKPISDLRQFLLVEVNDSALAGIRQHIATQTPPPGALFAQKPN
jgi:hypothetical protein